MKTDYLLHEKMELVLAALTPENRLVMRVCLQTGLRVGDALALKTSQLARQFYITETKTGKRRRVNLSDDLLSDLRDNAGLVWCFPGRCDASRHRTRQAVWKDVKRAARAFRLGENVGTHTARKCYAVELLDKYGDIERVRRALNHNDVSVTVLYACADKLLNAPAQKKRRSHKK